MEKECHIYETVGMDIARLQMVHCVRCTDR